MTQANLLVNLYAIRAQKLEGIAGAIKEKISKKKNEKIKTHFR